MSHVIRYIYNIHIVCGHNITVVASFLQSGLGLVSVKLYDYIVSGASLHVRVPSRLPQYASFSCLLVLWLMWNWLDAELYMRNVTAGPEAF